MTNEKLKRRQRRTKTKRSFMVRKISKHNNKKCKSLRKPRGKIYGGMPNCGNKSLFQVPLYTEQIANWKPLSCSRADPRNCGPTALKFIFPNINQSQIQDLSFDVEPTGITLERFNQHLYQQVTHLALTMTTLRIVLPDIIDFFKTYLLSGYISVIGLESADSIGHITTIAKDLNDNIVIFDGQTNMAYVNGDLINFVKRFNSIYLWCSEHINKHSRDSSDSQSRKKGKY